ncbi:MAG: terminase large subunit [Gammaproteobacteria bacterium]|nr:MAG: terminase large subunit [Gammaproteobacteria bacterium]
MSRDYCEIAKQYANDVVDGRIIACKYVQLACHRQLSDLKKTDFPYFFDEERASHVCRFIELLTHIKGEWSGSQILLEPWQIFILTTVFGWVDEQGRRRFKTVYTEVPRKNAKSTITSGVGNYLLAADNEPGAEVYSAATTRDQAKIVWQDAKRMADRSRGLQVRFGVATSAHSIFVEHTASSFKPLSRDQGGNLDGLNVHGGLIDELHAHKTREVWDVIETGTGARRQPLLWGITTAGFNRAGICYEQRTYVVRILTGQAVDEEYFGIIYTIDEDDDWTDEQSWIKANPNWGVSVNPDDIRRKARKAMEMQSATNNFLTKHLNVWVNAATAWMDMIAWERCGDPGLTIDQFAGENCHISVDLSTKRDIAALNITFRRIIDGEEHYYAFTRSYLPEEAVTDGRNSQYSGWQRMGRLIATPGNVTDIGQIEDDIRDLAKNHNVVSVAYDEWQAQYLANRLMDDGMPMVNYRHTVANMSEPMKTWDALVVEGRYHHDGCPVMTWMVSNVVAHLDAKDNIYPRKEFYENKIDGPVAQIMSIGRWLVDKPEGNLDDWLRSVTKK